MPQDWSTFTLKTPINAPVQKIYDMWTTRENLEKWFLGKAEFKSANGVIRDRDSGIRQGDTYEWVWTGFPESTAEYGTVLEANGKNFLKFVFGKAGIVSVSIKEQGGVAIVELVQENIPTDEPSKFHYHVGCTQGWTFYMANLKSILGGGIDVRNKNPNLKMD